MRIDNSCRNPPAHHHRCNHHHHHYREASNFFFLDYSTITFRCSASGCYYHQFDKDGSVIQRSSGSPSINHCNLNSFDGHHIILIIVYDIISFTKQYSLSSSHTEIIKNNQKFSPVNGSVVRIPFFLPFAIFSLNISQSVLLLQ